MTGGFTGRKQLYRIQNTNTGGNNGLQDERTFLASEQRSSGRIDRYRILCYKKWK